MPVDLSFAADDIENVAENQSTRHNLLLALSKTSMADHRALIVILCSRRRGTQCSCLRTSCSSCWQCSWRRGRWVRCKNIARLQRRAVGSVLVSCWSCRCWRIVDRCPWRFGRWIGLALGVRTDIQATVGRQTTGQRQRFNLLTQLVLLGELALAESLDSFLFVFRSHLDFIVFDYLSPQADANNTELTDTQLIPFGSKLEMYLTSHTSLILSSSRKLCQDEWSELWWNKIKVIRKWVFYYVKLD